MRVFGVVGIALILAGVVGLTYGRFSYTDSRQVAKVGTMELTVKDKTSVVVPVWLAVGLLAGGVLCLCVRPRSENS